MRLVLMLGYLIWMKPSFHSPKISRTLAPRGKTESLAKCTLYWLQILWNGRNAWDDSERGSERVGSTTIVHKWGRRRKIAVRKNAFRRFAEFGTV